MELCSIGHLLGPVLSVGGVPAHIQLISEWRAPGLGQSLPFRDRSVIPVLAAVDMHG